MRVFVIFLQFIILYCMTGSGQKRNRIEEKMTAAKYDNPNYVRDRKRNETYKPLFDPNKNNFKKPYHPAWQDYCDPYHCNDYHKIACGLHRKNMRFKWFQSNCHIILNNQCAAYRGFLKYDVVETKYCQAYVMYLRGSCKDCADDVDDDPVCAVSTSTNNVVLFKNQCVMDEENCKKGKTEYEKVQMFLCEFYLHSLVK